MLNRKHQKSLLKLRFIVSGKYFFR